MKKIFLLFGLVTFLSVTGTESKALPAKKQILGISADRGAPRAVVAAFNEMITDLMNINFPNSGWDDDNIDWTRGQGEWIASGLVSLPGNNAYGLQIHSARFEQSGNLIAVSYTVVRAE